MRHNPLFDHFASPLTNRHSPSQSLCYRDTGVDIDAGNDLVRRIGPAVRSTHRPEVLGGIGGFGALFELPLSRYRNPVLVSGTDGVGTKLKLAATLGAHGTVGIDLVAMCVNDILAAGAEPLYFLDYLATGKLDVELAQTVIEGIVEGCRQAGCALAGGETAEMPGMYRGKDYDLAGFAVGIVEKDHMLNPANVRPGQILLGLTSSGPHSNGYSLIREILQQSGTDPHTPFGPTTIGKALLEPTRIYVPSVLQLLESIPISALAHITGGGISDNLPRALPEGTTAVVDLSSWMMPAVFDWLQTTGGITQKEMLRTFNCGIGMILILDKAQEEPALSLLRRQGQDAFVMGHVESSPGKTTTRYVNS